MTQAPYRPSSPNPGHDNQGGAYTASNRLEEETVTLVPLQQITREGKRSGLTAKAGALVDELSNLRSNIDLMTDELQSLLATERAAVERAELLNAMTSHIRESLNFSHILNVTVEDARTALKADRLVVLKLASAGHVKVVAESVERRWPSILGSEITDPDFSRRYAQGFERGNIQAIHDIQESDLGDFYLNQLKTFEVKAVLTAPLSVDNQLYGLLIAHQCSGPRQWTESEKEFFRQFSQQVGYALEQALLLSRQQEATQQAQWLNQINSKIRESLKQEDIFNAAVQETRSALEIDRVVVYRVLPHHRGQVVAEAVERQWPAMFGADLEDPFLGERYYDGYYRNQVVAINDLTEAGLTDMQLQPLKPFAVRAVLVAPVMSGQQISAFLVAQKCAVPHSWSNGETELVQKVATQMGYALDQAIALEQQENAAKQARVLNDITSRLGAAQEMAEIMEMVVEDIREALGSDRVLVYKLDEHGKGHIEAEALLDRWSSVMAKTNHESGLDERYLKQLVRGKVIHLNNIQEAGLDDSRLRHLQTSDVKALMAAPLLIEKQFFGILVAHQCDHARVWNDGELNFAKQLANQVSFSLERISLIQQRQSTAARAKRLTEMSGRLQEASTVEDILSSAVEETRELLQADRVIVYEFDGQWRGTITTESMEGGWPSCLGHKTNEPRVTEKLAKAYTRGKVTAYANIYEANFADCHLNEFAPFAVKGYMATAIIANQKIYGLLIAHQCSGPRQWQDNEMELLRQIAQQSGYALDQALLLKEQEEAVERSRRVNEISFRIRESLDIERIFRTGVEEALKLMKCDRVVVYRFDDNWDGRIKYEAVKSGWRKLSEDMMTSGDSPCFPEDYVEPYRQGRVQVTEDVTTAGLTACHEEQLGKWQVKANVVVPILVNQKLYGLLGAHQCSSTRQWAPPLVESFRQVAIQLGYALDQALLLEEIEQARQKAEETSVEQRQQRENLQGNIENFLNQIEGSFEGDLTVRANVTEGEMGTVADFFNATLENLQKLVQQVQSSAKVTATTAQDSEREIKNLSKEALRQAEVIGAALDKIQRMTQSIQEVAANAQNAKARAQLANKTLQAGDVAMNRTVQGILAIQQTVEATARKVKNLGDASQKISRVLNLIRELANQTNLLALNASVAGNRGGDDDQGFAVANEVRTLAEQSANATKEIEEIVEEIQMETNEVVKAMEIGRKRVLIGTQLVKSTRQTLTALAEESIRINKVVEEIAQSATQQAQTSNEITHTMQEVAAIANQTSEQAVTVADSFTQLLGVADELQKSIASFKVN